MKPRYGGRYRPPAPKRSPLITAAGAQMLRQELDYLWREKRPQVTQSVKEAAALGDRSENAEYIYGKKQLREIDSRVRFLQQRLENIKVVDSLPSEQSRIYFAAWVKLLDEQEQERTLRIVGPDEINPALGYISIDSPLAKALVGKQQDDMVILQDLAKSYTVLAIWYQQ
ncbi:MAG: transcription elongation factor GreB [Gammaproteobacteria bacterium]|jgi:transcription elongation factor GreB|nr:transcription elongation factor GreB [Gammaproteobacteria bacterium]